MLNDFSNTSFLRLSFLENILLLKRTGFAISPGVVSGALILFKGYCLIWFRKMLIGGILLSLLRLVNDKYFLGAPLIHSLLNIDNNN